MYVYVLLCGQMSHFDQGWLLCAEVHLFDGQPLSWWSEGPGPNSLRRCPAACNAENSNATCIRDTMSTMITQQPRTQNHTHGKILPRTTHCCLSSPQIYSMADTHSDLCITILNTEKWQLGFKCKSTEIEQNIVITFWQTSLMLHMKLHITFKSLLLKS